MAPLNKRRELIRLSRSCVGESEISAVSKVLYDGYLGMGSVVSEFEDQLVAFFNRPVVCVSSGTAALHLALQAIGVGEGDEVLVPSITYVATYQAISATGAKPVSCDIKKFDLCLDSQDVSQRITPRTKAIVPMHYAGSASYINEIYKIAENYGLRVVEDAAHAFGSHLNGRRVGSFGDIVCFSFDGIKNITCGEGGCVVTDDLAILEGISDNRLLGVRGDSKKRVAGSRSWDFDVSSQGWRYHMSNVMAAIGIQQLAKCETFFRKRQELAKLYDSYLAKTKNLELLKLDYEEVVPHIYVVILASHIERNKLRDILLEYNIETGIHYKPNHALTYYRSTNLEKLEVTEMLSHRLLSLPLHPMLGGDDVAYVCDVLTHTLDELGKHFPH